jgi:uncharacterized integral membrane protein
MAFQKLYDLFIRITSDAGTTIDQLIEGTSPWLKRYRWLATHAAKTWKGIRKLPSLGKAPTSTLLVVCLMAILFYLVAVYCVLTGIRIPLVTQQPDVPLHQVLLACVLTGLCIGLSLGEALRLTKHAGRLWRRAPLLAKVQTTALFMCASAGAAAMPLVPLIS